MDSVAANVSGPVAAASVAPEQLRFHRPNRSQVRLVACSLEETIAPNHHVRLIWELVEQLDLSAFTVGLKVQQGRAGRSATDVRLLVALWLWAATDGVGSAREVARLCKVHDAYRWLCGGVDVNYHTLSDFRVDHESALDGLLTSMLAMLTEQKLVKVRRISQDGLRVRASAGTSSFRRRARLEERLAEAQKHVEVLKSQRDAPSKGPRTRQQASQERSPQERLTRTRGALAALAEVEALRQQAKTGKKSKQEPRASTTDPDARIMKMPGGGYRPAFNVQIATDTESRAIVGVDVTNAGTDQAQSEPMREEVQQRTGQHVEEHLVDGGYVKIESIERADQAGVKIYAPPAQRKSGGDPCEPLACDSPEVARWRRRMGSAQSKVIYKQRASTSETVNADLRTLRGLERFLVRGLGKVKCVALWSALAYNVVHFGKALLMGC
jgi:transposase